MFHDFLRKFILVFFDDILIYSANWNSHLSHLQQVHQLLANNQLYANFSKCQFVVEQVDYLAHVISSVGVAIDPSKLQAIQEWPTPSSLSTLCSWALGVLLLFCLQLCCSCGTPNGLSQGECLYLE